MCFLGAIWLAACGGGLPAATAPLAERVQVSDHLELPPTRLAGTAQQFGRLVVGLGDVGGDGFADFAAADARLDALSFYAGGPAVPAVPTLVLGGPGAGRSFARDAVGVGDSDGDGFAETAVGAASSTDARVLVYPGSAAGPLDAPLVLTGVAGSGFGAEKSLAAGDFDGDGYADLLVGSAVTGVVSVFAGSSAGLATVAVDVVGAPGFGASPAAAGDVDGDGFDDAVVADGASAEILPGSAAGLGGAGAILGGITGPPAGLGDTNGDGFADVGVLLAGGLTLYPGSSNGIDPLAGAAVAPLVPAASAGLTLAPAGDVDEDGLADFLAGDPGFKAGQGLAELVFGDGTALGFHGDPGSNLGAALAGLGDVDGDGQDDVAVAAPRAGANQGEVDVYRGSRPMPPPIDDVLGDCGGAFVDPGFPFDLQNGTDLHRIFLTDPKAVCNDGSPAVVYVGAATDPAHAADFVVHLQGGGDCTAEEECETRYCGTDFYDAAKMSSAWTPESIRGTGIDDVANAGNAFGGWNQVLVYYCSSDGWKGQAASKLVSVDGLTSFTMERRGHDILSAAFDALAAGAVSDDGIQVLPPLSSPGTLLFTGSSAGAVGVAAHLDWLAARFPTMSVIGVLDGAIPPDRAFVPLDVQAGVDELQVDRWTARLAEDDVPPFGDASCLATISAADAWECGVSDALPYQYLSTPFFTHMDLEDPTTKPIFTSFGQTGDEFAAEVASSLDELAGFSSVWGPRCGIHIALEASSQFLNRPLDGVSFEAALAAAVGGTPQAWVDPDGTLSVCQ